MEEVVSPRRIEIMEKLVRESSVEGDARRALRLFVDAVREACGPVGVLLLSPRDEVPGRYAVTHLVDRDGETVIESADPLRGDRDAPVVDGGILGGLVGPGHARILRDQDLGEDPLLGPHFAFRSTLLAVPVYGAGEVILWAVLVHPPSDALDDRVLETHLLRANAYGNALAIRKLARELDRARTWIREEIDQIALVERSLLPKEMPDIPGLDVAARWETFDRAGGDYYAFIPWEVDGEQRWTWILADASGHGPASAVIVAMLHVLLRTLPAPAHGPAALLGEINERLFDCPTCSNFMTAFVGCYEPDRRALSFALAGHPPPLIRRPDGSVECLAVDPAVPLGVLDRLDPPLAAARLDPGCVLLIYTDGLVDAYGVEGLPFGEDGLKRAFAGAKGDAAAILDTVFAAAAAHRGDEAANDDRTAVVVRSLPEPPAAPNAR